MSNQSKKLDSLLNDIEMRCDPAIGSKQCNAFSLDCLSLIRHKLPPIGAEGVAIATEYFEGRVPLKSVTDMLIRMWQYLDEHHQQTAIDDPKVSAIRAVICPLDAQKHPDEQNIVDPLSFFLTLINNVEPHFAEEELLLQKHFANCLKSTSGAN